VPFIIRDFRLDDFETLWRMDQECFAPGISYSRPELKFYIRRRGSFTLVAERAAEKVAGKTEAEPLKGKITGFIVTQTGRTGHIITIDVERPRGASEWDRNCCRLRKIVCVQREAKPSASKPRWIIFPPSRSTNGTDTASSKPCRAIIQTAWTRCA
jgi:hypothetical protein